jgi:K+/H+ antiporter YhaU regulatory subunit KhtT
LYPHDKLLVLGPPKTLKRAVTFLSQPSGSAGPVGFPELAVETVTVPVASPLAGRTLQELDLIRRFGVQVVAIERNGQRRVAPSGRDRIEGGDELLVLGTHEQIKQFAGLLNRVE